MNRDKGRQLMRYKSVLFSGAQHLAPGCSRLTLSVTLDKTSTKASANIALSAEVLGTKLPVISFFFLFFVSDIHTEAVQAALAKHKEEKMALPMPTKRRSTYVQSPIDNCTPPGNVFKHQILTITLTY